MLNGKNSIAKSARRVMERTHHVVHVVDEPFYCSCSSSKCVGTVWCATALTRGRKQSSSFPKIRFLCVAAIFGVACTFLLMLCTSKKPSDVFIVIITRCACKDKIQEFTQIYIWRPSLFMVAILRHGYDRSHGQVLRRGPKLQLRHKNADVIDLILTYK
jgi:hypothetical protein